MRLRTLLGDYPCTAALKNGSVKSDLVDFDFVEYSPTNKGFKPMVREVVPARFQHAYALYNAKQGTLKPAGLNGKRVGIRSFTTTTGGVAARHSRQCTRDPERASRRTVPNSW